jgi:ABC-2 type transport system ATP-binding protein
MRHRLDRFAVESHAAFLRLDLPPDEPQQRRLSRAAATHDGNHLAPRECNTEIPQYRGRVIREIDAVEFNQLFRRHFIFEFVDWRWHSNGHERIAQWGAHFAPVRMLRCLSVFPWIEHDCTNRIPCKMNTALPALQFENLTKCYGNTEAVSSLTLTVDTGTTFGLVGANGAGKTTLIKCLLDFCDVDSGRIAVFGVPATQTGARKRLAFLPERFTPPHYLTGQDFLRYTARMYCRAFDLEACTNTLAHLDLDSDVLAKPVRTLSKGMTQKLGLAGCLLSARDLLVLDEPGSGLDPKARALFKAALKRAQSAGRTIFLTSHTLADVDEICDRIAVLHQGGLRFSGSPGELKQQHGVNTLEQAFLKSIGEI